MDSVSFANFRRSLAGYLDRVCDTRTPLTVTRQRGRAVVVLSAEAYASMAETLHLTQKKSGEARLPRTPRFGKAPYAAATSSASKV